MWFKNCCGSSLSKFAIMAGHRSPLVTLATPPFRAWVENQWEIRCCPRLWRTAVLPLNAYMSSRIVILKWIPGIDRDGKVESEGSWSNIRRLCVGIRKQKIKSNCIVVGHFSFSSSLPSCTVSPLLCRPIVPIMIHVSLSYNKDIGRCSMYMFTVCTNSITTFFRH